jgi:hypothetical protein
VIDVSAERKESLEGVGDIGFDLLRRHARVKSGNYDDRHIDVWE